MGEFKKFLEAIIDTKRNPRYGRDETFPEPEDDDYDPLKHGPRTDWTSAGDDDDVDYQRSQLGLTAQYPLAKLSGKPRGLQIQSPEKVQSDVFKDKLRGRELVDTLRSKLYSGEKMTKREMEYLGRVLDKEYNKLKDI